eukprot:snap_masked-scaffold133_size323035-processed-gene-0.0 protein:Tk02226 transcript:snap_masked-scaffold133_size323035-processed-gene-0.0-mRNA-1 annotation:"protein kri1 homolog"
MTSLLGRNGSLSDEAEDGQLTVNRDYAQVYNQFRAKETLMKLTAKYGEDRAQRVLQQSEQDLEAEADSSDESEDEEAEELTESVERDFFKTLSLLKDKDPRIYDGRTEFFRPPAVPAVPAAGRSQPAAAAADKPLYWSDMHREVMLRKGGKFEDDDDDAAGHAGSRAPVGPSYVQEMESLKRSFRVKADEHDGDSEDEILVPRTRSQAEQTTQERDYRAWLRGHAEACQDEGAQADMGGLKAFWTRQDLGEDEKFLKDYILNKRYLEPSQPDHEPAYDEVAHDSAGELTDDEANLKAMENFEYKYNYRFEEPDPDFIKRYPRTVKDSMRNVANSRQSKRQEVKARKEREQEQKKEELKQLKALKKKEIRGKLSQLKKVAGSEALDFEALDIEGDFDPAEYDRQMAQVFAQYDDEVNEEERPEFSDLESDLDIENWDDYGHESEDDAEDEPEARKKRNQSELIQASTSQKEKKSQFAHVLERKKPVFDPKDKKSFEEYLEEYYKLDYEDLIGDLPCRFKYRSVPQNDFGLSLNEVLSAPDRELNSWVSLKKTCLYRPREEEESDIQNFKSRANNQFLKRKCLPSLYEMDPEEALEQDRAKKSEKLKKRKRNKKGANPTQEDIPQEPSPAKKRPQEFPEVQDEEEEEDEGTKKKKKKRKRKNEAKDEEVEEEEGTKKKKKRKRKHEEPTKGKKVDVNAEIRMSDDRLKAYGLKPNQFKRKARKKKYQEMQQS